MYYVDMKALIIGGSGGIGSVIAFAYARAGYDVALTYYQNKEKADGAVRECKELGVSAEAIQIDVADDASVKALFADLGELDVLVFAVAEEKPLGVDEASYADWRKVTAPMIDGAFLCTHYAVPLLAKSDNPNIIYIPSTDGLRPDGDYIAYQTSEAALIATTIGNAKRLAKKYKIRVNAVCPGPTKTGLWDKAGGSTQKLWDDFAHNNPLGRVTEPEDVARACLALSEDSGRYLNGNFLYVNGQGGY